MRSYLTRGGEEEAGPAFSPASAGGVVIALAVFAVLAWAVETSTVAHPTAIPPAPPASMQQIGFALMQRYVLPLEVIALMLTAAMIGAVILAVRERRTSGGGEDASPQAPAPKIPETRVG